MPHLPGLPLMLAVPGREGLINWLGSSNREMAVAQAEWRRGLHPALMHGTGEAMMKSKYITIYLCLDLVWGFIHDRGFD